MFRRQQLSSEVITTTTFELGCDTCPSRRTVHLPHKLSGQGQEEKTVTLPEFEVTDAEFPIEVMTEVTTSIDDGKYTNEIKTGVSSVLCGETCQQLGAICDAAEAIDDLAKDLQSHRLVLETLFNTDQM